MADRSIAFHFYFCLRIMFYSSALPSDLGKQIDLPVAGAIFISSSV
jgi:hypothetical protein